MGRVQKSKAKAKAKAKPEPAVPAAMRRGLVEVLAGVGLVLLGFVITAVSFKEAQPGGKVVLAYGPVLVGFAVLARGLVRRAAPLDPALTRKADARRWIFGGLAVGFAVVQGACVMFVIPNRLPTAALHLWTFPVLTLVMGIGTLSGTRIGWWMSVFAGAGVLLSTMLVIVRILISAAFLAGVYGAFGKAAATFSFVAIALIVQVVALLPVFHVRWLMSRRGRRAYA